MNVEENVLKTNAIVYHNGDVMLFRSLITSIACTLDMTFFPFDQVCSFYFSVFFVPFQLSVSFSSVELFMLVLHLTINK